MGELKAKTTNGIWMFKSHFLKDAINLAWMRDDQFTRKQKFVRPLPAKSPLPQATHVALTTPVNPIRHLSWEVMQTRIAQGLYFNYNERFTVRHTCQIPQLLVLKGHAGVGNMA